MHDSIDTSRIVNALDRLTSEVRSLHYEVARHREKLGPQPEWLLFSIPASLFVLLVVILITAPDTKGRAPNGERPRVEAQVELPDKEAREQ
jgi:hypothetical protein